MRKLIGITGKKRHGKTLTSKVLQRFFQEYGQVDLYNFANPLKELILPCISNCSVNPQNLVDLDAFFKKCSQVTSKQMVDCLLDSIALQLTKYQLPPLTDEEKDYLYYWIGRPLKKSYRSFMQFIGTEIFRYRDSNFWVKLAQEFLDTTKADFIIIGDVRFLNEAQLIKNYGGVMIKVIRPNYPDDDNHISEQLISLIPADFIIRASSKEDLIKEAIRIASLLCKRPLEV